MPVVPITLTISLCLVFTFVIFFLREHARGRVTSFERDSLLPLAEENPRLAHATTSHDSAGHGDARQSSGDDGCGCQNGSRAPCPGCLRRG
ncbi:MAG: hypothetical protein ABIZ49_06430 [Opitutaceae bacterium]